MKNRYFAAALAGSGVGTLGGLIGLGGAEFRLPLLIGLFRFGPLPAIILNKATSLVVVGSALPLRFGAVPFNDVAPHWPIILNLLAGSLIGAWSGAAWATRLNAPLLYKIISVLLVLMAAALVFGHGWGGSGQPALHGIWLAIAGILAGFGIGVVASLMGVAGGELLIPTLVLLFGLDLKLAGSLSLAVSLPTMIVGFTRFSRDGSFAVLKSDRRFFLAMAAGSVLGAGLGSLLLGIVDTKLLLPLLALILCISAIKVWRHGAKKTEVQA